MNWFMRVLGGSVVAVALSLATGCSMFDNGEITEDTSPVEGAFDNPNGGGGYTSDLTRDGSGPSQWGHGSDPSSVGAAAGELVPVDPGSNLNFPVIYFAFDTDVLVPTESAKLDKVAQYLSQNKALYLVVEGHCDQRGTEEYNRALGERRANAIRGYLAGVGVEDTRMRTLSMGKDKPAVDGSGESVWSQNRRGVLIPATPAK